MRCAYHRIFLIVVLAVAACQAGAGEEITSTKPYANLIGQKYSVAADLRAYGIYESLNNRKVTYISLIPPPGIGGPEVAFELNVPHGQVISILSAWQTVAGVYYLVELPNSDLPRGIPVRLNLDGDNRGEGADLNPAIYKLKAE